MLGKLYDALKAGGTPDDKAQAAAEEVAGYDREISSLRTEVRVVQAIGGVIIVVLFAVLWQLFALRGEVGELRGGFVEMRAAVGDLRGEMGELRTGLGALREEVRAGFAAMGGRQTP